jgi:protein phosphatase
MPRFGLEFDTATVTHQGHVREFNEDSVFANAERGIWLVADGMGGHRDGNVASAMIAEAAGQIGATATVEELAAAVRGRIGDVNERLLRISDGHSHLIVGSTVAALLIRDGAWCCLWAGDSRCYLVRGGRIEQLSRDHTEVQDLIDRGVIGAGEAKTWPRRNVITRAVGAEHGLVLEQAAGPVLPGDRFILCSDGLTGHVDDREILEHASRATARQACDRLLELALARGGKDNISIVTVNAVPREATTVVSKWR